MQIFMGQILNVFHKLDVIVYVTRLVPVALYNDICFLREVLEHHQLHINICNTWNHLFLLRWKVSLAAVSRSGMHINTASHSSFYQIPVQLSSKELCKIVVQTWLIGRLDVMGTATTTKKWGKGRQYWGLNWDYDPQWILTEEQREIQGQLMECCRDVIRPNAVSLNSWLLASCSSQMAVFRRIGCKWAFSAFRLASI